MEKDWKIRTIFDIPVFVGTKTRLLELVQKQVEDPTEELPLTIFTPNPEQLTLALEDRDFLNILKRSTINLPDGQGVVWALQRFFPFDPDIRLLQRIAGRGVFHDVLAMGVKEQWKIFLLGGKPGSGALIAGRFLHGSSKSNFRVDGGALDIRKETVGERERVMQDLRRWKPDVLFVAYGAPWQERWIDTNRSLFHQLGIKVVMAVGGSFEYEAGKVPKVSAFVERFHMEWLQRLVIEPWRWRRQLKGLNFFLHVILKGNKG